MKKEVESLRFIQLRNDVEQSIDSFIAYILRHCESTAEVKFFEIQKYHFHKMVEQCVNETQITKLDHCCGAQGFNPMLGDSCPACEKEK